jgi:hypothetical protein
MSHVGKLNQRYVASKKGWLLILTSAIQEITSTQKRKEKHRKL